MQSLELIKTLNFGSHLKQNTAKQILQIFHFFHQKLIFIDKSFLQILNRVDCDKPEPDIFAKTIEVRNVCLSRKL